MTAKDYAIKAHADTNHFYDVEKQIPYSFHLKMVVGFAERFIYLIPTTYHQIIYDACWCHDVIEDCRQTYNNVLKITNVTTADIVYAVTNEKGKTRRERANHKYYQGIKETEFATFVKLCDRLANFQHSIDTGNSMAKRYKDENRSFISSLYDSKYEEMFYLLRKMESKV